MTATVSGVTTAGAVQGLWERQLDQYPETRHRMRYLGIAIAATSVLYYEFYVGSAVAPTIIAHYGMSFPFYVYIAAVASAFGAFGSLAAGLADRWGRANIVAYGLLITGLLTLIGVPNASSKWSFGVLVVATGLVEGVILVATPALIRDFSPQLGRASAMGFWSLGPVAASLLVAVVSSNTLNHLHAWQDQFTIAGIAGLIVGVVALLGLKELSPQLRDQLMVSHRDRALIEARARGLDVEDSLRRPWRQMLHLDIIGSAFGMSGFLIIYTTAIGFFTVYFTSIFHFSLSTANSLGDWFWASDAGALIVVGIISDRVRVRKPFMVLGAVGIAVTTIVFLNLGAGTSYSTFAVVISILAAFIAIAYAPWMASFTETVEKRNPALVATGLAVWGWVARVVVAVSIFILPSVVSSMTPIVTYGAQAAAIQAAYPQQLATLAVIDPKTRADMKSSRAAQATAVGEIAKAFSITPAAATARLTDLAKLPQADLVFLAEHGSEVVNASVAAPGQWKDWWWVCVGGELAFLPFILVMAGRWSPRKAREDAEEHDRKVQEELAAMEHQA